MLRIFAVALLLTGCAAGTVGSTPSPERHVIYLHGRIVQEQQSARPQHPQHGYYELDAIVDAFRSRGFTVSSAIRPKSISVSEAADEVVAQVKKLIASGVAPEHITVVGASMGGAITLRTSARLQHPEVRFVVLSPCLGANIPAVAAEEKQYPSGRLLVIRDESDVPSEGCPSWKEHDPRAPRLRARELVINTGLGHGFLYRPMRQWIEPTVEWINAPRTK